VKQAGNIIGGPTRSGVGGAAGLRRDGKDDIFQLETSAK
jgi:hypothetical protein